MSESTTEALKEMLEEIVADWATATYPSAPVSLIDLPEVKSANSEFFYNYYTKDERTVSTGVQTVLDISSLDQDIEFVKKKNTFPRSVILKVAVYNESSKVNQRRQDGVDDSTYLSGWVSSNINGTFIKDNKNDIVFEGGLATSRFSSLILMDNMVDETFYNALNQSVAFKSAKVDTTLQIDTANEMSKMIKSPLANLTNSPNAIRRAMGDYQPKGVAYAPTDLRQGIALNALRSVRFVEWNSTINNAVIGNILMASLEDRGNIYQDELTGTVEDAIEIQQRYVEQANPSEISSEDFELEMAAVDVQIESDILDTGLTIDEASIPIGFYIEKFEIASTADGGWERRELDPIIIEKYGSFNIFDPDIKYGASYVYDIHIIYATAYEATAIDLSENTSDEHVFAVSLIASKGTKTKVECVESIAPAPPQNLMFNFDYQNDNLRIFWEEAINSQRDVMRYQIFRRRSIDLPFTLIAELDFDNSTSRVVPLETAPPKKIHRLKNSRKYFVDDNFEKETTYIYALAGIDARGLTSSYSEQVATRFDVTSNKLVINRISSKGAPKPYPNLYLERDLFVDTMRSSGAQRMRVYFDPEYYDVIRTLDNGSEISLDLLANQYKLQIINLDLQGSQILDMTISDETGEMLDVPITSSTIKTLVT